MNSASDFGPPLGCVLLLLVQQDAEDVRGDCGADQGYPDSKTMSITNSPLPSDRNLRTAKT